MGTAIGTVCLSVTLVLPSENRLKAVCLASGDASTSQVTLPKTIPYHTTYQFCPFHPLKLIKLNQSFFLKKVIKNVNRPTERGKSNLNYMK